MFDSKFGEVNDVYLCLGSGVSLNSVGKALGEFFDVSLYESKSSAQPVIFIRKKD